MAASCRRIVAERPRRPAEPEDRCGGRAALLPRLLAELQVHLHAQRPQYPDEKRERQVLLPFLDARNLSRAHPHAAGKLLLGDLQLAAPFAQRVAVIPHHRPFLRLPAFGAVLRPFLRHRTDPPGFLPFRTPCQGTVRISFFHIRFRRALLRPEFRIAGSLPCCDGKNIPFPEPRNADRAPTLRRGVIPMTERSRVFPEVMPPHGGTRRRTHCFGCRIAQRGAPNGPIAAFDRTKVGNNR